MKYIDADKLRAEIERLKKENDNIRCNSNKAYCQGYGDAFIDLLPFLDTLEEPDNEELEGAAEKYSDKYCSDWAYRLEYEDAFIAGAEWQKEQMLKEAVEGEVIKTNKHTSVRYKSYYGTDRYFYGIADKQFKAGDKVRIIILPKEDGE